MQRLENFLTGYETLLNIGCAVPVLNSFNGISKALLGTTQITAGVALAVLTSPFYWTNTGERIHFHCAKHIIHGAANVVSGLVLSLPIIGNRLALIAWADNIHHNWEYDKYEYVHFRSSQYNPSYWFEKAKNW